MTSLLVKDAYLQNLARKICAQPSAEPQKRKWGGRTQDPKAAGSSKKKRRKMQKKFREQEATAAEHKARSLEERSPAASRAKKPVVTEEEAASSTITGPAERRTPEADSLFALDVLRQRLHERIQEARGQGSTKELSPATLEKRRRRKQERERKKRKRKELRAKEKAAKVGPAEAATAPAPEEPRLEPREQTGLIFNKVDVGAEEPASRAQRRREKRRQVKGGLPPLTGRNYRQLLERLRARRTRLEALREQDAGRARALQARMQWTQLLYKAEGVKIRDSEPQLRAALQRKEKRRAQRRRQWEKRTAHVVEKMQQRQDKRRQNLRKKKVAKAERRMEKARKKGRILPQDLERAGLA